MLFDLILHCNIQTAMELRASFHVTASVPLFLIAAFDGLGALIVPFFSPRLETAARLVVALASALYFVLALGLGLLCLWFAKRLLRPSGKPEGTDET